MFSKTKSPSNETVRGDAETYDPGFQENKTAIATWSCGLSFFGLDMG
jgi:hypothetical protein